MPSHDQSRPRPQRAWLAVLTLVGTMLLPEAFALTFVDATAEHFPDGLPRNHYAWGDCDGDGDEDLLVSPRTLLENGGPPEWVFRAFGDTGELAAGNHQRALFVDVDDDGDLDIVGIGNESREALFLNDGACRFVDVSDRDGDGTPDLGDGAPSMSVSVGDLEGDGDLDLYVGNYERHCVSGNPTICGDCMTDRLWRNLGDGIFEDVTISSGVDAGERALKGTCVVAQTPCQSDADCEPYPKDSCSSGTCARSTAWADYDDDGDMDILVGNYRLDPNILWENDGGGAMTNVAAARGVEGDGGSDQWGHVLGVDWGDYDNDGDLDLYTATLAHNWGVFGGVHDVSPFYRNEGTPDWSFTDVRGQSGMRAYDFGAQPDWAETSPLFGDYDNDGDLDLYVTHIYPSSSLNYSTLYSNEGDGTFTETTRSHGADLGGFHNYSAAWADFDRDGDLDLVTQFTACAEGCPNETRLFRNEGGSDNAWIQVRPRGQAHKGGSTNRFGVGVRVEARHAGVRQVREVSGGSGYHVSLASLPVEFGFGSVPEERLEELELRWSDGTRETFTALPFGERVLVFEVGVTLRRGPDPAQTLDPLDEAARVFPYEDPVLGDGLTWFYLVEEIDEMLMVGKDEPSGSVVLSYR